jgi:hypothetical protein
VVGADIGLETLDQPASSANSQSWKLRIFGRSMRDFRRLKV